MGITPATPATADADPSVYDRFELAEAVCVLSHFDTGRVSAVQEFRRGSRRAPKLLVKCERGLLILKRLAPGRDSLERVAFTHRVQRVLAEAGYPLPRLIPQRSGEGTFLAFNERVYELFECITGQPFDHSASAAFESGQLLARLHAILSSIAAASAPQHHSYHCLPGVPANLAFIPHRLSDDTLNPVCAFLSQAYERAAQAADAHGLASWPRQLIHGDWHPGNVLFKQGKAAAVIDYDTVREASRVLDLANGALQFSVTRTTGEPESWPDAPDEERLKRFCQGYDSQAKPAVSQAEVEAMPWLMIEAIIAEAAVPIAVTGKFGKLAPGPILRMVERKVRWIQTHAGRIARLIG